MGKYSKQFYEAIRSGCQASAARIVPDIYALTKPGRVVDVGCGEGHWGKAFEDLGCKVIGFDGAYVDARVIPFQEVNLEAGLPLNEEFDLCISLEVAEHLQQGRAASFVEDLCKLAPDILFSAAIPFQGGVGHLNEQYPDYWKELFALQGHSVSGKLRWDYWNDENVEWWYRQNLMFASNRPERYGDLFEGYSTHPVIHPVLWASRQ